MGPQKAAQIFASRNNGVSLFVVTLYGSLAATGRGHMTDVAIRDVLEPLAPVDILWEPSVFLPYHPNGMKFEARDAEGHTLDEWTVYSIGGGALSEGTAQGGIFDTPEVYGMNTMTEIMEWCNSTGRSYWEYVDMCEDSSIWDYLQQVWETMQAAVERGINNEGRGRSTSCARPPYTM